MYSDDIFHVPEIKLNITASLRVWNYWSMLLRRILLCSLKMSTNEVICFIVQAFIHEKQTIRLKTKVRETSLLCNSILCTC